MPVQEYFVITAAQRADLVALNTPDVGIDPRAIDTENPGIGINQCATAVGYAVNDEVTLEGRYAAPKRIVDDPDYQYYAPSMVAYLLTLPWCALDDDSIFAPFVWPI